MRKAVVEKTSVKIDFEMKTTVYRVLKGMSRY
jgi:hypothetical protein